MSAATSTAYQLYVGLIGCGTTCRLVARQRRLVLASARVKPTLVELAVRSVESGVAARHSFEPAARTTR